MIGFKLDELMAGSHRFTDGRDDHGAERPLMFSLTWGNSNLLQWLNPFSRQFLFNEARGVITVDGLATKADCQGTLHLLYFTERKIRYELFFTGDDGRPYRYLGEKINLWPWNLHKTHVTGYGTITDLTAGRDLSRSVVHFPFPPALALLPSFRLRWNKVFKYPGAGEQA